MNDMPSTELPAMRLSAADHVRTQHRAADHRADRGAPDTGAAGTVAADPVTRDAGALDVPVQPNVLAQPNIVANNIAADHIVPVPRPRSGLGRPTPVLSALSVPGIATVAVVGMGYVGLPTALALHRQGIGVIGLDVSQTRLSAIRSRQVDLLPTDLGRLAAALEDPGFRVTDDADELAEADAVIICVPTPVDAHLNPDLQALAGACAAVVARARPGQVLVLTSTTYVGCTRDLLVTPLAERGLRAGEDVFVAFSPERIDPGIAEHEHTTTPRVLGGVTPECAQWASDVVGLLTESVHLVSSAEAAELTKLYENTFRAVTLALANEFAGICRSLDLDPVEVTRAAATKPYGFLATYPGPGVGGHCIPCDPHYLLWQLRSSRTPAPLIEQAMTAIAERPHQVVARAVEVMSDLGRGLGGARVLVVGVAYKPGVQDVRETPAVEIIPGLEARGASVWYVDPLVPSMSLPDGRLMASHASAADEDWDLVLLHTVHPQHDYSWVSRSTTVLDATYRFESLPSRHVV
ncbi:nucleotide sugar dehydrogenase [Modestobacter muralis]